MNNTVNFKLAKLLKEKGFNEPCREGWVNYLESFTGQTGMPDNEYDLVIDRLGNTHLIESPNIAEIVMWLYKKHDIWISVDTDINGRFTYIIKKYNSKDKAWEVKSSISASEYISDEYYKSPTETYEVAIEYCLEKII